MGTLITLFLKRFIDRLDSRCLKRQKVGRVKLF
jgi:hypothetical protein